MGNYITGPAQEYDLDDSFNLVTECPVKNRRRHKGGFFENLPPRDVQRVDQRAQHQIMKAAGLCCFFMFAEAIGGAIAGSLAVMTDAAHLLTDFASFIISLFAMHLAIQPASKLMPFGWHRAEIIGALISVFLIWIVTTILVMLAIQRTLSSHYEIDAKAMLITSSIGVAVNVIMGLVLHQAGIEHSHGGLACSHGHTHTHAKGTVHEHGHSHATDNFTAGYQQLDDPFDHNDNFGGGFHGHNHDVGHNRDNCHDHDVEHGQSQGEIETAGKANSQNINVRAAYIHAIGDLLQSIGVMVAAIIIYFRPDWKIADPICTFLFSVLVLFTTMNVISDIMLVLMEATPRQLNYNDVKQTLLNIKGIQSVHELRVWSLTLSKQALSVHVVTATGEKHVDSHKFLVKCSKRLEKKHGIVEAVIQVEAPL